MAFGADYNPEQWPDEVLDQDLELMKQAKVNLVSLGIFSWAMLEPSEGHYDFSYLARVMDKLHAAGIKVDLATATASPPAWMAQKYPETLPVTANGQRAQFGSRQQYAPASPIFRQKTAQLVTALAQALGKHPALVLWHVSNELGCHISESFDPATVTAFQQWLSKRYQHIDQLNHCWSTAFWSQKYTSFEQVQPPNALPTFHNPAQKLDWKRFSSDMLRQLMQLEISILKEKTPHIPVTTNFMELFPETDYWKFAQDLDLISDDSYPDPADPLSAHRVAFAGDLSRSLGGGRPYLLMEQTTAGVQWRQSGNSWKRPGQYRSWSMSRIARGANGIMHFQWRQSPGGAEAMHSAMVQHSQTQSQIWPQVCQLGQELEQLAQDHEGELLKSTVKACVAVILNWEALWAAQAWIAPVELNPFQMVIDWHRSVWETGYAVDFCPVDADLTGYQVVIIPGQVMLNPVLQTRVEQALESGASVIISAPFGIFTDEMRTILGGYHGEFSQLTGVKVSDLTPATLPNYQPWGEVDSEARISSQIDPPAASGPMQLLITAAATGSAAVSSPLEADFSPSDAISAPLNTVTVTHSEAPLVKTVGAASLGDLDASNNSGSTNRLAASPGQTIQAGLWAEQLILSEGTKVLATYSKQGPSRDFAGQPAITQHAWGKGQVFYTGSDLANPGRTWLFKLAGQAANLKAESPDTAGIEVVHRGKYVFILNHGEHPHQLKQPVWDLLTSTTVDTIPARGSVVYYQA